MVVGFISAVSICLLMWLFIFWIFLNPSCCLTYVNIFITIILFVGSLIIRRKTHLAQHKKTNQTHEQLCKCTAFVVGNKLKHQK